MVDRRGHLFWCHQWWTGPFIITCHLSYVFCHISHVSCHLSLVTFHPFVTFHISDDTFGPILLATLPWSCLVLWHLEEWAKSKWCQIGNSYLFTSLLWFWVTLNSYNKCTLQYVHICNLKPMNQEITRKHLWIYMIVWTCSLCILKSILCKLCMRGREQSFSCTGYCKLNK